MLSPNAVATRFFTSTSLLAVACIGEPAIPNDIAIGCSKDTDCLSGQVCSPFSQLCVLEGSSLTDRDGDRVPDADDICPDGNDQLDGDNDGVPNACDTCFLGDD